MEVNVTKNVTLRLDEEILKLCRYEAIEAGTSLSQWVADTISKQVESRKFYESMRIHALSVLENGLQLGGSALSRDAVHGA